MKQLFDILINQYGAIGLCAAIFVYLWWKKDQQYTLLSKAFTKEVAHLHQYYGEKLLDQQKENTELALTCQKEVIELTNGVTTTLTTLTSVIGKSGET